MADELKGTNIAAPIVPFTSADEYPTHLSEYGKGGWREKETVIDRNAIPLKRRTIGMAVYVLENQKLYILKDGFTNDNWVEFKGSDVSKSEVETMVSEGIANHNTDANAHSELFAKTSKWSAI